MKKEEYEISILRISVERAEELIELHYCHAAQSLIEPVKEHLEKMSPASEEVNLAREILLARANSVLDKCGLKNKQ